MKKYIQRDGARNSQSQSYDVLAICSISGMIQQIPTVVIRYRNITHSFNIWTDLLIKEKNFCFDWYTILKSEYINSLDHTGISGIEPS